MSTASTIRDQGLCIGCGYCASFTTEKMQRGTDGFPTPPQAAMALPDEAERLVAAACPGRNGADVVQASELGAAPGGATDDYMWGRYFTVVTARSTDDEIRHLGSSGGVLTALAKWLVCSGRVERVLVTTYDPDYAIGTVSTVTDATEAFLKGAGSKYCPSSPLAALASLREMPVPTAVIGRPCDIATMRRALKAGDPLAQDLRILLSFFCAGTPSDVGNRALLNKLGIDDPAEVTAFRHRGQGWPGNTRADLASGETRTSTYNDSWGQVLRRHVHTLCKVCPDGIGEQADLVAADAWYVDEDGFPIFAEAEGRSLLIARTPLGRELYEAAIAEGALTSELIDIRDIDQMQPGQINRRRQLRLRAFCYRLVGQAMPSFNARALRGYESDLSVKQRLRVLAATLRRLLPQKLRRIRWGRV